jgi:hypothetical protein
MNAQQKQAIDSLVRIRAFMDANPMRGPIAHAVALATFDEALGQCRQHAATQLSARSLDRGAQRQQRDLKRRLRDHHMRPIVTIARSLVEPGDDASLPASFLLPRDGLSVTHMVQASDGMIAAARSYEARFIEQGLPEDFLAQFTRARDALVASAEERAELRGAQVGAGAGLRVALRRARLAINRLDAIVRSAYEGNDAVIGTWRRVKRVHLLAGTAGRGEVTEDASPVVALVPESQPTPAPALERAA